MERVGAVIVGVNNPAGTALLTSFKANGIPAVALDAKAHAVGFFSRYRGQSFVLNNANTSAVVGSILELGARLRNWVLIPNADYYAALISRSHDLLSRHFRVATANWNSVRYCIDKGLTHEAAQTAGVPVPITFCPKSRSELEEIVALLDFETAAWILKPRWKNLDLDGKYGGFSESVFHGSKAVLAHTREMTIELSLRAHQDTGVFPLIQERVPGGPELLYGVMIVTNENLSPIAFFVTKKIGQDYELGSGSYAESTYDHALVELALRLIKTIGCYGFVQLEFKKDPRDGTFRLIEINPRPGARLAQARASGVDLAYMLFCAFARMEVSPRNGFRTGIRWLHPRLELSSMFRKRRPARIFEILRHVNRTKAFAYSIRDPLPFLIDLLGSDRDTAPSLPPKYRAPPAREPLPLAVRRLSSRTGSFQE